MQPKEEQTVDTDNVKDSAQGNGEEVNVEKDVQKKPAAKRSKRTSKKKELEEMKQQLAEQNDKFLRLFAEFDNFKKRTMREKLEIMRNAAQDTLSAILPILDDFDRAKANADAPDSNEQFSDGVKMVYNKLYATLDTIGLHPMDSNGEDFDPELHEAITEIPAPSDDLKGKVVDTIEKGYYLNDKIIRHAKVVVGK